MKRVILFSTIAVCVFSLTVNPRSCSAETKTPAASAHHRAIVMEVLIVAAKGGTKDEHALEFSGPSDEVAVRIRELESEGRIVVIDRIRLTTVENQKTVFQAGTTAPVASGRTFGGRAGGAQTSHRQQELGTLGQIRVGVDLRTNSLIVSTEQDHDLDVVDVWAARIEDKPGGLADKLAVLAAAGAKLEFVGQLRRRNEGSRNSETHVTVRAGRGASCGHRGVNSTRWLCRGSTASRTSSRRPIAVSEYCSETPPLSATAIRCTGTA